MMKKQIRRGFTLVELLVVIAIIAVLAGLATPAILKAKKNADKAKAINNVRQVGMALGEFENEWGSYPDESTREDLEDAEIECQAGNDANAYLSQLIASKALETEEVFFAKGVRGTKLGDNIVNTPDEMLAKGENSFGYVMFSDGEGLNSSNVNATTPVLVAPLKSGGTEPEFDPQPYNEKMVYSRPDGSAVEARIKPDGRAGLKKGRTLFSIGEDTMWGSNQPEVKEPTGLKN